MPVIEGLQQNTPEWLIHRHGMVTASSMWKVMAKLKDPKKEAAPRANYKAEVICEILTDRAIEHYVSPAMEQGTDREPLARAAYEIKCDVEVEPGGFWVHDTIPKLGASPDGLVGEDGLLEIKCPLITTHWKYLRDKEVPEEYLWQMMCQMACSGRKWCDFVSYSSEFSGKRQLWIKRVPRDEALIAALETETLQFLEEIIAEIKLEEAE